MKITKIITTEYQVDLINDERTAAKMAEVIDQLKGAGVEVDKARVTLGNFSTFHLIVSKKTYYDDSTLKKMEA